MTIFDWIVLGVLVAAAAVIIGVVTRHRRKLVLLDLEAMPQAKLRSKKYELIEGRLKRRSVSALAKVKTGLAPLTERLQQSWKDMMEKLHALERKYRHASPEPKTQEEKEKTRQKITALMEQGDRLFKDGNYGEAEAVYLDVIRLNPKEVEAYEGLGEVYLEKKEYEHAIQTLEFARGLNPNEERIYYDLGMVFQLTGDLDKALRHFKQCVELAPNNPRNLDALLSLAIEKKDRLVARETLRKLQEANPENQKLGELEAIVREL